MKIAFDLDGTLNRYPKQLGVMMHELKNAGHHVIVLTAVPTGETKERREEMLRAVGIMPASYHDIVMQPDDGRSKGKYCKENGIEVLIDDSEFNLEHCKNDSPQTCRLRVMP